MPLLIKVTVSSEWGVAPVGVDGSGGSWAKGLTSNEPNKKQTLTTLIHKLLAISKAECLLTF